MSRLIEWDPTYSIGLQEIDDQHKVLVNIINQIWDEVVSGAKSVRVLASIAELEQYTVTHFQAEENFMRSNAYSDFKAHKKRHDAFVERIRQERLAVESGKSFSLDLVNFLKDWLLNHILIEDRAYAQEFQPKKLGESLGSFFARLFR